MQHRIPYFLSRRLANLCGSQTGYQVIKLENLLLYSFVVVAALALCDWSSLQRTRRSIARTYCSPRLASDNYALLDRVARAETGHFVAAVRACGPVARIKPLVMAACANMFTQYMCSTRFAYDDPAFSRVVRSFDEIFWDINNGYAVDFLPWLLPFYTRHMNKLTSWAKDIR